MEGNFEYMHVVQAMDSFHVDDIGNTAILANNDQELEYVIIIESTLGRVVIKEFGPMHPRIPITKYALNINVEAREFNEKYINKRISNFLNAPYRDITQVRELDAEEAAEKLARAQKLLLYTESESNSSYNIFYNRDN